MQLEEIGGSPPGEAWGGREGVQWFALDAVAGLGAAAFAAVMLWSLPAFLGLPTTAAVAGAIVLGCLLAYAAAGPHGGARRLRLLGPLLAVLALGVGAGVLAALPATRPTVTGLAATAWSQLLSWPASGTLAAPGAYPAALLLGFAVGLPVFQAARAGRPAIALLLGFALLVVEWEFVDNATVRLFWPLVLVSVFWLAADRARDTALGTELDIGSPTPWTAFGMAGLAGAAVFAVLLVVPRQGSPANLGALGLWIDRLPVIGTLERATREGNLGYPTRGGGSSSGSASGSGSGSGTAAHASGFDLSQTGFGGSATDLGGPVHLNQQTALVVTLSAGSPPAVLYLRGAVRDVYDGVGWTPGPGEQNADPNWPSVNAGAVGQAFIAGRALPAPFDLVNARVTLQAAAGGNLFTALSPLRLSVPVTWDRSGEAWTPAAAPAGYVYTLTSAVLGPQVYTSTAFAPYLTAGGQTVSPDQALRLAEQGQGVAPASVRGLPRDIGSVPSATDLALPASLPVRDRALARQWTRGLRDPLLEALAIQQHLLTYPYTLNPPLPPAGRDFVDNFLFGQGGGYCTYYSTAMAVLLRAVGIPSRWVEGFRTTVPAAGGTFQVSNAAAHAWVEAYVSPYGWLTFDPTPASAPTPTAVGGGIQGATRLRHGWIHLTLPDSFWLAAGLPAGFLVLLLVGAAGNYAAERRSVRGALEEAQTIWRACERVGARFGRRRRADETPAEYARELADAFPALAGAAERLAAAYGHLRYGTAQAGEQPLVALRAGWEDLQAGWRSVSPMTYPWRRWL